MAKPLAFLSRRMGISLYLSGDAFVFVARPAVRHGKRR
jgi:hypothetical protein